MDKEIYVIVGQYNHEQKDYTPLMKELVDNLRELCEVNVFDMLRPNSIDEVEKDEFLFVHHYARPKDGKMEDRVWELVRDIMALSPKACFIDYDVEPEYRHFIELTHAAIKRYGIRIYTLNKRVPFRSVRNLCWDIRFWIDEQRRREHEDDEISQVEGYSGHGTMDGFRLYKIYEKQHKVRKHVLEMLKKG